LPDGLIISGARDGDAVLRPLVPIHGMPRKNLLKR
jgi:hypothetical protein